MIYNVESIIFHAVLNNQILLELKHSWIVEFDIADLSWFLHLLRQSRRQHKADSWTLTMSSDKVVTVFSSTVWPRLIQHWAFDGVSLLHEGCPMKWGNFNSAHKKDIVQLCRFICRIGWTQVCFDQCCKFTDLIGLSPFCLSITDWLIPVRQWKTPENSIRLWTFFYTGLRQFTLMA